MILPEQTSATVMLPKLRQLEEEEPELHIIWNEELQEIQVQIMGEVQIEILKSLIKERFDVDVEFGQGNIVYKETIANTVEGVGHFEPLRHYAEVHLLLEPLERGSGVVIDTQCSEDILDKNWQRLILTHLLEKEHRGVLTGAPITDIKITLAAGRAHQKHTEGGDFRQATYRAVRQGLRMAESILLEPYYKFRLEIPQQMVGRAMTDIEKMHGTFETPDTSKEMAVLQGVAPVSTMQGYQKEVLAYSKGMGRLFTTLNGYDICHNAEEIIEEAGYDPDHDLENPCGSVFCSHGAGYNVSWDEVPEHMHLESVLAKETEEEEFDEIAQRRAYIEDEWIDTDEIDKILEQTFYANQHNKSKWKKKKAARIEQDYHSFAEKSSVKRDMSKKYLLVDGYNVIYAWDELKELLDTNVDAARGKLLDEMCNYQGMKGMELIVVFDAYRVKGHETEITDYLNIHVVYTKEAETADQYIEKFAHTHGRKYDVTVATSDGLEQIIIRGQGCRLLSARELKRDYEEAKAQIRTEYLDKQKHEKSSEGAVIREKKLIRSNRLSKLTQNDMNLLSNEYHLHKILDLRTPMEVEQEADLEIPEASYMNIPFFMESMVGVSREQETKKQMLHMQEFPDMKDIYIMMIQNKFCNQQITKAVREVMTTENGSVLWHCTEGKDRCGLLSAIILFLLDVSEEDVMEDYLKTNKAAIRRVEKIRKKLHVAGFHQEKIEKLEGYFVAKEEFLNAALKTMKEDHGSINQFIKNGLHISMKEKQQFKDKILE